MKENMLSVRDPGLNLSVCGCCLQSWMIPPVPGDACLEGGLQCTAKDFPRVSNTFKQVSVLITCSFSYQKTNDAKAMAQQKIIADLTSKL